MYLKKVSADSSEANDRALLEHNSIIAANGWARRVCPRVSACVRNFARVADTKETDNVHN